MTDLAPYRAVSRQPATRRNLSVAVEAGLTRLGMTPGQKNVLLGLIIRDPARSIKEAVATCDGTGKGG